MENGVKRTTMVIRKLASGYLVEPEHDPQMPVAFYDMHAFSDFNEVVYHLCASFEEKEPLRAEDIMREYKR